MFVCQVLRFGCLRAPLLTLLSSALCWLHVPVCVCVLTLVCKSKPLLDRQSKRGMRSYITRTHTYVQTEIYKRILTRNDAKKNVNFSNEFHLELRDFYIFTCCRQHFNVSFFIIHFTRVLLLLLHNIARVYLCIYWPTTTTVRQSRARQSDARYGT